MACWTWTVRTCDSTNLTCEQRCKLSETCINSEIFPLESNGIFWVRSAQSGENGKVSYSPYGPMWCQQFAYYVASGAACGSPGSGMVQCATPDEGDEVLGDLTTEFGAQMAGANCQG